MTYGSTEDDRARTTPEREDGTRISGRVPEQPDQSRRVDPAGSDGTADTAPEKDATGKVLGEKSGRGAALREKLTPGSSARETDAGETGARDGVARDTAEEERERRSAVPAAPAGPPAVPEQRLHDGRTQATAVPVAPSDGEAGGRKDGVRDTAAAADRNTSARSGHDSHDTGAKTDGRAGGGDTPGAGRTTAGTHTPGAGRARDGHDHDRSGNLIPAAEQDAWNERMRHAVSEFVEDPHRAVQEAGSTFEEIVAGLAKALEKQGSELRAGGSARPGDGEAAGERTEELRLTLQRYRDLTERLLHL